MASERAKKLTEEQRVSLLERIRFYRDTAETGNADLMERMERCEDVTVRDPWRPEVRAELEEKGKNCLSIPMVKTQLKQVVGHVVQNPKDIVVMNERGGLRILADVISALIHHSMTDQDVAQQVIQWFDQGATTGCSYLALFIDYDSDPLNGNLEIVKLNEFEVLVDPTCQHYDLSKPKIGAKYVIWQSEVDRSYVEARWPEAIEDYDAGGGNDTTRQGEGLISWLQGSARAFTRFVGRFLGLVEEREKLRYPLTHTWWIEWKKVHYFYDLRLNDLDPYILTKPKEVKAAKDAAELRPDIFVVKETIAPQVNHTITLGVEVLCEHIEDEFKALQSGQALLPVVRFSPHFNNGYPTGLAEDMIGLQEYINLVFTLGVNIMQNQPNSGWFILSDAMHKAQWLKDHGNEDNTVINLADYGGTVDAVRKIDPATMPDFLPMATMGMDMLVKASNIRTEEPNTDSKDLSGRAILAKQQGAITGVSPSFSNFDYSLALIGKVMSHVIRACPVYSDSEIKEIIEEERLLDPQLLEESRAAVWMMIAPQGPDGKPAPFPQKPLPPDVMMATTMQPQHVKLATDQYTRHMATYDQFMAAVDAQAKPMAIQMLIDAVRNPRRGRYNCRVALSPKALTMRARNFAEILETNQALVESGYAPLSDQYVLENSDLPKIEEELARRGYK